MPEIASSLLGVWEQELLAMTDLLAQSLMHWAFHIFGGFVIGIWNLWLLYLVFDTVFPKLVE